jgi:hypothetical protein
MISRRLLVAGLGISPGISLGGKGAVAQAYPACAISLVVPFAAGGFNDVSVRIVAQPMSKTLGASIIVENDAGPAWAHTKRSPDALQRRVEREVVRWASVLNRE